VMRSFMNKRRDEQGERFNSKVSTFFEGLRGLAVKNRVKKVGSLRELQGHLGDIDSQHKRISVR